MSICRKDKRLEEAKIVGIMKTYSRVSVTLSSSSWEETHVIFPRIFLLLMKYEGIWGGFLPQQMLFCFLPEKV